MTAHRRLWPAMVLMVLAGVGAGVLWAAVAEPPRLEVRSYGAVLPESSSARAFDVEMTFIGLGTALSLVCGLLLGWLRRERGVLLVPVVVLGTALAAVIAWRVGVALGPDDPREPGALEEAGLEVGQSVALPLAVESPAAFVLWPVAGLLGLVLITWLRDGRDAAADVNDGLSDDPQDARSEPSSPA